MAESGGVDSGLVAAVVVKFMGTGLVLFGLGAMGGTDAEFPKGVGSVGQVSVGGLFGFVGETRELGGFFSGCAGDSEGISGDRTVGSGLGSLLSGLGDWLLAGRWDVSWFAVALDV